MTKQLHTHSFLWQHFHFFVELYLDAASQNTFKKKLKFIFGSPQLIGQEERIRAEKIFRIRKQRLPLPESLNTYVVWQIIVLLTLLFFFILFEKNFNATFKFLFTGFTLLTLINCGVIMEQKKWIFNVEFMRILVFAIIIWPYFTYEIVITLLITFLTTLTLFYRSAESAYLSTVYKLNS